MFLHKAVVNLFPIPLLVLGPSLLVATNMEPLKKMLANLRKSDDGILLYVATGDNLLSWYNVHKP